MKIVEHSVVIKWGLLPILLCTLLMVSSGLLAQPKLFTIIKGERPVINLNNITASAYQPGRLYVKLSPAAQRSSTLKTTNLIGIPQFNIRSIDSLNRLYRVSLVKALFNTHTDNPELIARHEAYGFGLWYELRLPTTTDIKKAVADYKNTKAFEVVEPVYKASLIGSPTPFIPNDPTFPLQWNLKNTGQYDGIAGKDISMADAWGITTGDTSVLVSVHDNAINTKHIDLAQNIAIGKQYNFINNSDSLTLNSGHGSHCAGIIAAVNNNNIGISGIAGGNGTLGSGIRLISYEVFGPNGTANGFAESLVYAADHGSVIANNSWGYDDPDVYDEAVLDAIDYYSDFGGGNILKGGLPVFAAGNNGRNWRIYPGAYSRVICVAASNNKDVKANYSNFGDWVDIIAPGGESFFGGGIYSTESIGYSASSGTSYACPHVVGVAALVASVLKGKASANDVRDILLSTTDDIYPLNPNFTNLLGTGRLNAFAALKKAQALLAKRLSPINSFTITNNCNSLNLNWIDSTHSTVVIAFNKESNFGSLEDGKSYAIGDTINNGGTIIYKGNGSNFNLPIIDSLAQYSFKIWSVDNNNQYSFSRMAETSIKPVTIASGANALQQNFDYPPLFPTKLWHGSNTKYDYSSWIHTANDTSSTGAGDDYSMCLYNYKYNKTLGAVDTLTGPQLRVKGADSIVLSFWRAYQFIDRRLTYSDSLEVVASTDCGKTFSSVWKKGGKELATVTNTTNKEFYPFGIDKWKKETINLTAFNTTNQILIGFRGYNGKGNNLFIDNVSIDVRYKTDVALTSLLQLKANNCSQEIKPELVIRNVGNTVVSSFAVSLQVDNKTVSTTSYHGSLLVGDSTIITLNTSRLAMGSHTIKAFTSIPNDGKDEYSLNDTLTTKVTILPIATLPFKESFEGSTFPPIGWEIKQQPADNITWLQSKEAGSIGTASAYMQNFVYNFPSRVDDLLTPPINIGNLVDSVFLFFDYAAATKADSNTTIHPFDTLEISITKDCGATYTTIYKHWGDSLQTTTPKYINFVPTANEWRRDSINLNGLVTSGDKIRIRFRNTTNYGNNIYIDNVRCYAKLNYNAFKEKGYLLYPNPAKKAIVLQHYTKPVSLQNIIIYDELGKRVMTVNYNGNASGTETINIAALPAGLYAFQLIYSDKKIVEKVLKLKN